MADETTDDSMKPWYKKPENILTYGGLALAGYLGLQALDTLLPLLNRVLENLVYTSILAGTVAILGWVLVSQDFHRLAWYGYKTAMRWLTSFVVDIDPIAIMKTFVQQLKKNLLAIRKAIGDLKGQARELEDKLKEKAEVQEKSMNMAAAAKARGDQKGMRTQMTLQMRKAGRAEKSSVTYQGLLNKLKTHISVMEKVEEAAQFMIADIEDTVEEESEKRKMIRASYKAMTASRRILAADQQREMYDMALESTTKDYYSKLGEIEQFMTDSQSFINGMDLENGVYDQDALTKLEEWEKRSTSLLEGGSGKTKYRVTPALTEGQDTDTEDGEPVEEKRQSFANLFEKL
jgi:hypothetical protein